MKRAKEFKDVYLRRLKTGVITSPYLLEAGITPVTNLIMILSNISERIYVISGCSGHKLPNNKHVYRHIVAEKTPNTNFKPVYYFYDCLKIMFHIIKLRDEVKIWFFFLGEIPLIIPIAISKALNKHVILMFSGSPNNFLKYRKKSHFTRFLEYIARLNMHLSDYIIVYSSRIRDEHNFDKYKSKTIIASEHFLDLNIFRVMKPFNERNRKIIGYIGRLEEEKGIFNLIKAMEFLDKDILLFIYGDGTLRPIIENYLLKNNLKNVQLFGWISHSELPKKLNDLRLLILPSFTEGLPNVMLEGMACGTPILSTPVGSILDVITEGNTGFIMRNNSPECISDSIVRVLNHPDIAKISENACSFVNINYTYEKAVEKFKRIFKIIE